LEQHSLEQAYFEYDILEKLLKVIQFNESWTCAEIKKKIQEKSSI